MVDYNAATGQFSRWTSFAGPGAYAGPSFATHFQGISSPAPGVYTLAADTREAGSDTFVQADLVTVRRGIDGKLGPGTWVALSYLGAERLESANSVAGNQVVGIVPLSSGIVSYQATVNLDFQSSDADERLR